MSRRERSGHTAKQAGSRLLEIGRYAPVFLLVAVALVQVHWAFGRELLTPAKGGGFGLFSTVDRLNNRVAFLHLVDAQDNAQALPIGHLVAPGHPLREPLMRARSLPTEANLARAARALAQQHPTKPGFSWRLEVWKQDFDAKTGELRRIRLARHELERDGS